MLTPIYSLFEITANAIIYFAISLRKARNKTDYKMTVKTLKIRHRIKTVYKISHALAKLKSVVLTRNYEISHAYSKSQNMTIGIQLFAY